MSDRSSLAVLLAAGEGTRMRSGLPKVLHPVAGLPMIGHVLASAKCAGIERFAVVVGPSAEGLRAFLAKRAPGAPIFEQTERRGTAHAVLAARAVLSEPADDVLVLYGDTPLVRPETLARLRAELAKGAAVVVLGFRPSDPAGYGRLLESEGRLVAIREEKDATAEERQIRFCNAGLMAFAGSSVLDLLGAIGNANAKGEFYLTDAVEIANQRGLAVIAIEADAEEVGGVNTRVELAAVEAIWQARARKAAMLAGVSLVAPDTVFLSHDTVLEADVTIEPNVVFGPGVRVESGAVIHAFSHLEGARVESGAAVGPFARLRPGTALGPKAKVGNFVEVKNAEIGAGAKVSHLTYIGDAKVGAEANVGAGTITCNYDGFDKALTIIGEGAFIGSNSALVAPVTIGDGAYVASGSVVTEDVAPDALAIARARQVEKPGWAERFRAFKATTARKRV
ncbi:bifunctional N-acetylglucosamine-1-phosphate uridyltransferase/glucosamine-1-phosphate acetyltransferase [Kaistia algarum]|uniref:bifunctional UDP-N-acetylglucosamine diphosphorylase/glucosamine-1-phosphate N-acetyltransferase GlmU n=1 Tax=Kaistia algarum TaxID=2083279 RepID=UPI000CE881DF|nr:bifunctional UDP-N-acetylglucosamine diphosphorylase/glucosamine-1-phosphate N-acetyltransferase GlmU [Kaistia algarum]MCX5514610.1 bifunctional UDP-N-acetylglucosamine diphosphorylase/glucosamine-1-phosphate N-acetyltransferase GlmU [Kaistia algarum]PPE79013.1 bifunctional N-acetylglucosamine-1-phosphate uridyltransferase/glucosamine-1-phosphate acetyltransferase [Kaistia algarum]